MNVVTPRIDFLLSRLVREAGELRDQLATGDWEAAGPLREQFDEGFSALQRLIETGHAFEPRHANVLAQLRHVHAENESLVAELRRTAGVEIGKVSNVRRINSAYAPLGPGHRPRPCYVDGSA